jgi:branched-chain amino acid aminotransferase
VKGEAVDYKVWVNGKWVPRGEASIRLLDRGFRLGDAVFDTTRTFDGKVFRLHDHLKRLYRSLKYVRIDPGQSLEELEELSLAVLEANEEVRAAGSDHMVTQIITRGEADMMARRAGNMIKPTICVWIESIDFASYAAAFTSGARLVTVKTTSQMPSQLDTKVKHYSRLHFVMADLEAWDVDPAALPLLRDMWGNVTESNAANIFAVIDGCLVTPPSSMVLEGISRRVTLDLAAELGIPTREQTMQPYDLYTADEVFLTATQYSILPVGYVDGRPVGSCPGPKTEQLLKAWNDLVGMDIRAQVFRHAEQLEREATLRVSA